MDKFGKSDHKNNSKRKTDFTQKLIDGDLDTLKKFLRTCTVLDEEDEKLASVKFENAISEVSDIFDIDTIKSYDCKIIPSAVFGIIAYSSHIVSIYELDELASDDYDVFFYPNILTLDDGSVIRVLIMEHDDESEEDSDGDIISD